jgi:hypothetical protein
MSITSVTPNLPTIKNFWQKREGKLGKGFLAGAAIAAFFAVYLIKDIILATLSTLVQAGLLGIALLVIGAVLFALYYVLTNPTFKCIMSNIFQSSMRWLAKAAMGDDIDVLLNNVERMKDAKVKLDTGLEGSAGAKTRLERKIAENEQAIQKDRSKLLEVDKQIAANRDQLRATTLALTRQTILQDAGRRNDSNSRLKSVLAVATKCYNILVRWQQLAEFQIDNTEQQVSMLKDERDTLLKAFAGMSLAQRIIKGDPEQLKLVNAALEHLAEDNANKLGAIEDFSRYSEKLLANMDIEQGAMAGDAEQMLAQFEQKLLTAGSPDNAIVLPGITTQPIPVLRQSSGNSDYTQFFTK